MELFYVEGIFFNDLLNRGRLLLWLANVQTFLGNLKGAQLDTFLNPSHSVLSQISEPLVYLLGDHIAEVDLWNLQHLLGLFGNSWTVAYQLEQLVEVGHLSPLH